jgi:hypothetical protein
MISWRIKMRFIVALAGILVLPVIMLFAFYMIRPPAVLTAFLALRSKWNEHSMVDVHECTGVWSVPVTAKDSRWTPGFPETSAAYFFLPVTTTHDGRPVRLDITGDFPVARFMSLALYDSDSGRLLSSLRDSSINPSVGSENPFVNDVERDTPDRRYVVRIAPSGYYAEHFTNKLTYPKDVTHVTLMLRVYNPDDEGNGKKRDATGGVGLPRVHAYYTDTNGPLPECRSAWRIPRLDGDARQSLLDAAIEQDQSARAGQPFPLYALRSIGSTLFENPHVTYGFSNLSRRLGDVVILRFRAPTFVKNAGGVKLMEAGPDVRYWSVCLGGLRETNTIACATDVDVKIDQEGFASVAILPADDPKLAVAAAERGIYALNWGTWITGGYRVILRVMENNKPFAKSYANVPELKFDGDVINPADLARFESQKFIGDYGATGTYFTRQQFLEQFTRKVPATHFK